MKIGIDARLWNETGVGRYIRNLVKYLGEIDQKNEYVLFVRSDDYQRIKDEGLRINWKIVEADIRWHTVEEQLTLPGILEKEKLDLVHFPYFSVPYLYSRPFVVTIHDLIPLHFDTGRASTLPLPLYKAKRLGYKLVLSQAIKKASKIIAVSNATKEEVVKHLQVNPDKIVVTYEGVDEQMAHGKWHIEKNHTLSAISNKSYFLYVGNAYPHKNLERLLLAFSRMVSNTNRIDSNRFEKDSSNSRTVKLVLVGKEDYFYRRLKEQVVQMGLSEDIIFYGQASDDELTALYHNAKALIIPSLMEGFGLPALEAMANKCLVLASDIAALRETCGEAAIYFNPYDVDDIAEKMSVVCFNDLNLPAGKAGHFSKSKEEGLRRVKISSWKKMAEETLQIYKEVGRG